MRVPVATALTMMVSAAAAGEIEDAHRQALAGRDTCRNCLAQEYTRGRNRNLSDQDFTWQIAEVCASERKKGDAGGISAFVRHKARVR